MIDFEAQTVTAPDGATHRSEIDPGSLGPLLKGQDDINLILMYAKAIETFEYAPPGRVPWRWQTTQEQN